MKSSLRWLTYTFALAAASMLVATAAEAQTVIDHVPYTVGSGGNYVLNSNLNYTGTATNAILINITASNVTIDFQGHFIAGIVGDTTQTTNGVVAQDRSNITLKNGTIAYCQNGINIQGTASAPTPNSVDHVIDNMRMTYCYVDGIYIASSPASRITNCQVSQGGYSGATTANGIVTFGTNGSVTVANNVVDHITATNSYGIFVADNGIVRQNSVTYCVFGIRAGKYQDNLTYGCTTPYSGGTDAGGNN